MILKGSQRAGSLQLARHLLKTEDNEHVELHELRGFIADELKGALKEVYAISKGTKCQQFLFSLSLNPPETVQVPVEIFEDAIAKVEKKLGLTDQPRAIVFHEKEGRRHAHCVWSRIDVEQMKAIHLPHFKLKLRDVSRQLYLENDWQMPRGLMNSQERDPLNFSQAEWQQAQRIKQDPRQLKQLFQDCWAVSDSQTALAHALRERGFFLAQGDRRGFVALDWRGEVYAISRWVGVKAKVVRARLGNPDDLPTVQETKKRIAELFSEKLQRFCSDEETRYDRQLALLTEKRAALVTKQRESRKLLRQEQATRRIAETKARASRLPKGLKALWFRVTGKYQKIIKENEKQTLEAAKRDRCEWQRFIEPQQRERRALQHEFRQLHHHHNITMKKLHCDLGLYLEMSQVEQEKALNRSSQRESRQRRRARSRDFQ